MLTNNADTTERLRLLRNHGHRRTYEHVLLGYNWRLAEIQTAIGRVQLRKLDAILERKRVKADWMSRRLGPIPGVTPPYQLLFMHSRVQPGELALIADAIEDAVGHDQDSSVQPTVPGGPR